MKMHLVWFARRAWIVFWIMFILLVTKLTTFPVFLTVSGICLVIDFFWNDTKPTWLQ